MLGGGLRGRQVWALAGLTLLLVGGWVAPGPARAHPRGGGRRTALLLGPGLGPEVSVRIVVDQTRVLNRLSPTRALGVGLDGHGSGELAQIYTRPNLAAIGAVGLGPRTYRLRTELGSEAWHWNPDGRWSDPRHHRGYWTSSPDARSPLPPVVYGYNLPRRGNTFDQANDAGFSRVDDGDPRTFWKSDPYLNRRYTGQPNGDHPQWLFVDLGSRRPVDAVRVRWGDPYATRLLVQSWGGPDAVNPGTDPNERWTSVAAPFTSHGGTQQVGFAPTSVRFLRLLFLEGSGTALPGAHDPRDRLGVAVRELEVGTVQGGRLIDLIHHSSDHRQTPVYVSSTDPWHRSVDRNPNAEQPSFDRFFRASVSRLRSALVPVATLYGTPADAAAELRFLRSRHYPLSGVEIGEEPDGQLIAPEDYGALYRQFARVLRRVDPHVRLGGPGYATSLPDWTSWPDARGERSFTRRFLQSLGGARPRIFNFFSFEWYPFDDVCGDPRQHLLDAPGLLTDLLDTQRAEGVGRTPIIVTEYGWGAFAGRPEVDLPGALLDADFLGTFLSYPGARAAYFYGAEPAPLMRESSCPSFGNLALFQSDASFHILRPLAAERVMAMLARTWMSHERGSAEVLPTSGDPVDAQGRDIVTSYALRRPDGRLAVMLVNKGTTPVQVSLAQASGAGTTPLPAPVLISTYGPRQYAWHPAQGLNGYARPNAPPLDRQAATATATLAPYALAVIVSSQPSATH
jgi:hypothetical protein